MGNEEIYFDGKKFISLKRASEFSGYAKDYVGQLCRDEKLKSKRIGRDWFVDFNDLELYKNKVQIRTQVNEVKNESRLNESVEKLFKLVKLPELPKLPNLPNNFGNLGKDVVVGTLVFVFFVFGFVYQDQTVGAVKGVLSNTGTSTISSVNNLGNVITSVGDRIVYSNFLGHISNGLVNIKEGYVNAPQNIKEIFSGLFKMEISEESKIVEVKEKEITSQEIKTEVVEVTKKSSNTLEDRINNLTTELRNLKSKGLTVQGSVVEKTIIERTIEKTVSGLSDSEIDVKLQQLNNKLMSEILSAKNIAATTSAGNYNAIALTNKIDILSGVTLNNVTFTGSISGFNLPYLPLAGGALTDALTGTSITLSDVFNGTYFNLSSTTATNTIAGKLELTKSPTLAHAFGVWAPDVAGSNISDASLYINPSSTVADGNLLGLAVNGNVKFLVDAEGDVFVKSITSSGTITQGLSNIATLNVEGNSTLGDAITDLVTFNSGNLIFNNSATSTIQNNMVNAWSIATSTSIVPTLTISTVSSPFGYVGIGTTSPYEALSVAGNGVFAGNIDSQSLTSTSSFPYLTSTQIALTSLTPGSITFIGAGGIMSQNNANLYWDNINNYLRVPKVIGSSFASGNLTLQSTSDSTKGKILFGTSAYDEVNNRLGIAKNNPAYSLDVAGIGSFDDYVYSSYFTATSTTASSTFPMIVGSQSAGGNLFIGSTNNATKGKILFGNSAYDEVNNRLGIGTAAPTNTFDVNGESLITSSSGVVLTLNGTSEDDWVDLKDNGTNGWIGYRLLNGSTVAGIFGLDTSNNVYIHAATGLDRVSFPASNNGTTIFNDDGYALSHRFESDNDANLLFLSGSSDNVGIGTSSPYAKLSVSGIGVFDDYVYSSYFTATSTTASSTFPMIVGSQSAGGNLFIGSTNNATKGKILFGTSAYDEATNMLGINTATPTLAGLEVYSPAIGTKSLVVKGIASQTGALQEWQNSAGTVLARVSEAGDVGIGFAGASTYKLFVRGSGTGIVNFQGSGTNDVFTVGESSINHVVATTFNSNSAGGAYMARGLGDTVEVFRMDATAEDFIINENSSSLVSFRIEGDNNANLFVSDAVNDRIGVGTSSPWATLSVEQGSTDTNVFVVGDQGTTTPHIRVDGAGITYIEQLQTGAMGFDTNAGAVSWWNLPVTSSASAGTVESYSAQLDSISALTLYSTSDGAGSVSNISVGISTTTPWRTLSVTGTMAVNGLTAAVSGDSAVCISAGKEITYNSGVATCTVSSQRFKHDINKQEGALDLVMALNPVTFKYNSNDEERFGFIAEEVNEIDPRLVAFGEDGLPRSVRYEEFTSVLTKAIQEQQAQIISIMQNLNIDPSGNTVTQGSGASIIDQLISLGVSIRDGIITAKEFIADKITTKEICLDDICIDRNKLKELLDKNQINSDPASALPTITGGDVGTPTDSVGAEPQPVADQPPAEVIESSPLPELPTSDVGTPTDSVGAEPVLETPTPADVGAI